MTPETQNTTPNMDSNNTSKGQKALWIIFGIILIVLAVYFLHKHQVTKPSLNLASITPQQVIAKLPANFPVEAGASDMIASTTTTVGSGMVGYGLAFHSENSIDDNVTLYENYCHQSGGAVTESVIGATKQNPTEGLKQLVCIKDHVSTSIIFGPAIPLSSLNSLQQGQVTTFSSMAGSSVIVKFVN